VTRETEILKVLKPYASAFPNVKMQPEAWPIYARALSIQLTPEEVNAAMMKLLNTVKFFPTIAEIIEAANSIRETAQESTLPDAGEAWEEVIRQGRMNGLERPWTYSCPEVKKALERFGKSELMHVEESQTNTARSQFMRIYAEVIQSAKTERENNAVLDALPNTRAKLARGKIVELAEVKRVTA
jgi:hypothetical protein